ncbi:hypothetical protein [Comamonas aquatilis]|uniref:hypothetical protein n=1 Tax=Comamonas aquatilis TaxID=1778406 RepID=UPI0039F0F4C8
MQTAPAITDSLSPMPQESASLRAWEYLAQRARQLAIADKIEYALLIQSQALQLIRRLLCCPILQTHPDRCLDAWVASHHHIAHLLTKRQQLALAANYLCDAHMGLLSLIQPDSPCIAVQQALWRHLRDTHVALLHWQRQHGHSAEVDAALQASVRESDAAVCRCTARNSRDCDALRKESSRSNVEFTDFAPISLH